MTSFHRRIKLTPEQRSIMPDGVREQRNGLQAIRDIAFAKLGRASSGP